MPILPKIQIEISVILGSTRLPIRQLLRLGRGAVIAFDTGCDDPVLIYANDELIARGEVLVEDDRIRVRIIEQTKRQPVIGGECVAR